ncbi:protein of unknown function [Pseudomonas sp. JV551A1]|uniref:Uncharacterized protein n=1 Tax=Pseudomonas inefficax TaxID=2078786 RepID=A0AAQ1P6W4_9PSED|nr:protein of unknown function [Pseudomonas sp. JV551A1]SPO58844.1 protein of unknown function [Pseudomonas inefficax]
MRSNPGNFRCDTKSWGRFAPLSRHKAAPTSDRVHAGICCSFHPHIQLFMCTADEVRAQCHY